MKNLLIFPFLLSGVTLAAPPLIPPGGLTQQQIIAQRQEANVSARHTAAQNVVGSRLDEFSTLNPGSGQARALFNNTVMSAFNQQSAQPSIGLDKNFSAVYRAFASTINADAESALSSNPFALKIARSQVNGMPFLKSEKDRASNTLSPNK